MKLVLPYPVSANRYWRHIAHPKTGRPITLLSREAKEYRHNVGWLAKAAGFRKPTRSRIALALTLIPKNGVVMDLSNCLKVAEDALQGIVYENDRQVRSITLAYGQPDGRGALIVEITEIGPAQSPIPLPAREQERVPF